MLAFVLYIMITSPAGDITMRMSFAAVSQEECVELAGDYIKELEASNYDVDTQGKPAFACMKTMDL